MDADEDLRSLIATATSAGSVRSTATALLSPRGVSTASSSETTTKTDVLDIVSARAESNGCEG